MKHLVFVLICVLTASCATPEPALVFKSPIPAQPAEPVWPDEPFRAERPTPGPQPALVSPEITTFELSGVEVFLVARPSLPVVAMDLVFPVGARTNPARKSGLASLSMSLMGQGTKALDRIAFGERQADLGSSVSAWSGLEDSGVSVRTLKRNLDATLDLTLEMLRKPGLRQKELGRLVDSRKARIKQSKATPKGVGSRVFGSLMYGLDHPRGRITTEASVGAIALRDCKKFVGQLGPKGARLFVVGDITQAELTAALGPRLKGWRGGPRKARPLPASAPRKGTLFFVNIPGAAQSQIYVGHPGPGRTDADYEQTMMMARILGGGFSSRLNMNLREKQGISYGARAGFSYHRQGSHFAARSSVRTDATDLALREMFNEIKMMRSAEPTEPELRREKQGALLSLPARFTTVQGVLSSLRSLAYYGLPFDYYTGYSQRLAAVQGANVATAGRDHLRETGFTVLVVGDAAVVRGGLDKIAAEGLFGPGEVIELDADGNVL